MKKNTTKYLPCFESKYKFFDWAIVGVFFDLLPTSIYKLILYRGGGQYRYI